MEPKRPLQEKSYAFAIRIVRLSQYLVREKSEYVLSRQILKSGTSIGANASEGRYAASPQDLRAKLVISLKECEETLYWLRLLKDTEYLTEAQYSSLNRDCQELRRLLTSSVKTLQKKPE